MIIVFIIMITVNILNSKNKTDLSRYISRLRLKHKSSKESLKNLNNSIVIKTNKFTDLKINKPEEHLKLVDLSISESVKRHEVEMKNTEQFLDDNLKSVRKAELISKLYNTKDEQEAIGSLNESLDLNLDYLTNSLFSDDNNNTESDLLSKNLHLNNQKQFDNSSITKLNDFKNDDISNLNVNLYNNESKNKNISNKDESVLFVKSLNELKDKLKPNE